MHLITLLNIKVDYGCRTIHSIWKADIIQMCSQELSDEKSALSFKQFCQLLSSVIHFNYHEQLESLKNNYAPFAPNADTQQLKNFTLEQREQCK
jgi:hypothetical protein